MKLYFTLICLFAFSFFLLADQVNEDQPQKGTWDLNAKKVWEVSKYGKKSMAIPNVGCVLDDGTVCVFDYKYRTNYLFSGEGKFITSFAKKGEGPGEVKSQRNIWAVGNKFIAGDYSRLHYFSNDGKYLKTLLLKGNMALRPPVFLSENEYIALEANSSEFYRYNVQDGTKKMITKTVDYQRTNLAGGGPRIVMIIPSLTPEMVFDMDQKNQRIFYGKNDSYQINVMDFEGEAKYRFSVKRQDRIFTKQMKRKINKEMPLSKKMWSRLPKKMTFFHSIQIIEPYVFVYITEFAEYYKSQHIDIFSSDGIYLYRSEFTPEPGEEIYLTFSYKIIIKNDHLYAAIQKKNGDMKVVKYRITLPPVPDQTR